MDAREASARAAKALALLDTLDRVLGKEIPLTADAVRLLSDNAWAYTENLAGVRPASAQTRELVAHLADTRIRNAATADPFAGLK